MRRSFKYRKNGLQWLLLLLTGLLFAPIVYGQTNSTKGTDFWLGFMDNLNSSEPTNPIELHIYISADATASGVVTVPGSGFSQTFSVAAGGTVDVLVPAGLVLATDNELVEQKGIHVTADKPVTVYLLNYKKTSSDAAIVFPTNTLGSEYLATSFHSFDGTNPSELLIVAVADNTELQIIPTDVTLGGGSAGGPINVTLQRGETFLLQSYGDLSGTWIGNHPTAAECRTFALFSGNKCTYVPNTCGFCDHLVQQMIPLSGWGSTFITVPLETRFGDLFRIMAAENGTLVSFDGGSVVPLAAGQFIDTLLFDEEVISSNLPISVAQYSRGGNCDGVLDADPFMILLNPIEQRMQALTFNSFTSSLITQYFLNLLVPTSSVGSITLDGTAVPAGDFLPVGAMPDFSYAQLAISPGNHRLESPDGMTAYVYGYGEFESYGYVAGTNLLNLSQAFSILYNGDSSLYYDFYETVDCSIPLTVAIDSQPGFTYEWFFGDGALADGATVSHFYTTGGTYELTLVAFNPANCAPDTIRWPINVDGLKPGLPADTSLCDNSSILLELGDPSLDITWPDGSSGTSFSVNTTGTVLYTVTDGFCTSVDSIEVLSGLPALIDLPATSILCEADDIPVVLSPGSFSEITWENGSSDNPRTITTAGIYSVEVLNSDGCAASLEFEVVENCSIEVVVPNAFSPNGDGLNDRFGFNPINLDRFELAIFDRWGSRVFVSDTPYTFWDGTFRGKEAEMGTYIWQLVYRDKLYPEIERVQTGTVTLIR